MAASRNRRPENGLDEALAAALAAAGLVPGARVCVALSGGVDSVVLLDALARQREVWEFALTAAHVHHGLSPNADAWSSFCVDLCVARGIPFHGLRVSVDRTHPGGLEAAAREARHAALAQIDCDWLAFGHHADDQAETLLFRLLRGTGLRGAAAMHAVVPARSGQAGRLRPLLEVRRAAIVACAQARGLTWIEDESNADPRFTRNLLRHRILPLVEQSFPGAVTTLGRAAAHFHEADALLEELAALDAAACGEGELSRGAILKLSDARLRNLLRARIRAAGMAAPEQARLVEAVRQLRAHVGPLRLDLGAAVCCAYRDRVWLECATAPGTPAPVVWRGEAELMWGRACVRFEPHIGGGLRRAALEAAGEVVLCGRWPDLGLRQGAGRPRRSFKNLCQESGIPPWLRDSLPVLRVDGHAAWIGEIGVAAEFACGPGEAGVLPRWMPVVPASQ